VWFLAEWAHVRWDVNFDYDTGLYHAQAVRWLNEHGSVFGLGNLHARLGFNSLWLVVAAVVDNGVWDGRSEWVMPALLLGGAGAFLHELCFARRTGERVFAGCVLGWLMGAIAGRVGLSYDVPAHLLGAMAVLPAFRLAMGEGRAGLPLFLCAGAFTIKPVMAVPVLFCAALSFWTRAKGHRGAGEWARVFLPAAAIGAVWVARNVVQTGFPLYPLPAFRLPVGWAMDAENARWNYAAVRGWARLPGAEWLESLRNGFAWWFKPWLAANLGGGRFPPLILLPCSLAACFWGQLVAGKTRAGGRRGTALFFGAWPAAALAYWFVSAPDARFAGAFGWVLLGTVFLFLIPGDKGLREIGGLLDNATARRSCRLLAAMCVVYVCGRTAMSGGRSLLTVGTMTAYPAKRQVVGETHPVSVWAPNWTREDGGTSDQTGDTPLPSTPSPRGFELRKAGDLSAGFRAAGTD
jgi:hypothetical protein